MSPAAGCMLIRLFVLRHKENTVNSWSVERKQHYVIPIRLRKIEFCSILRGVSRTNSNNVDSTVIAMTPAKNSLKMKWENVIYFFCLVAG